MSDPAANAKTPAGPLAGVKIVDLTSVMMGPYATMLLGDYGADVIKVESPEGDVMRHAAPMKHPRMGAMYLQGNRNKRSIVLDLKKAGGRAALLRLAETADVLVHNVRPAAMARLKLGADDVAFGTFDLDDVGAVVAENHGRVRTHHHARQVDDPDAGERALAFPFAHSAVSASAAARP